MQGEQRQGHTERKKKHREVQKKSNYYFNKNKTLYKKINKYDDLYSHATKKYYTPDGGDKRGEHVARKGEL